MTDAGSINANDVRIKLIIIAASKYILADTILDIFNPVHDKEITPTGLADLLAVAATYFDNEMWNLTLDLVVAHFSLLVWSRQDRAGQYLFPAIAEANARIHKNMKRSEVAIRVAWREDKRLAILAKQSSMSGWIVDELTVFGILARQKPALEMILLSRYPEVVFDEKKLNSLATYSNEFVNKVVKIKHDYYLNAQRDLSATTALPDVLLKLTLNYLLYV